MALPLSIANHIQESQAQKRAGNMRLALQRAEQALGQAQQSADAEAIASSLACVADCQYALGHFEQTTSLAQDVLAHASAQSEARADALRLLGNCAHEAGDLSAAEDYFHQAIDLGRQLGYRYILFRSLHSLSATVYIPRGQFELALAADQEALRLAKELEAWDEVWFPLATIGWVQWIIGRRTEAFQSLEEWRLYAEPNSLAEGYYFCLLADLLQAEEKPEEAPPVYAQARSVAEAVGDPALAAELRVGLGRYHRNVTGNASAAYEWADDALSIARRAGCHDLQSWAQIERGRASWLLGDLEAAKADLMRVVEFLTPIQANFDLARAYLLLSALHHQQNHPEMESAWLEAVSRIISGGYTFLLEQERSLVLPLLGELVNHANPAVVNASSTLLDQLARISPSPLYITTLGRFRVLQGRRRIPSQAWRRRKAGELFRFLLVHPGRTCLQDQVTDALWPDKSPASAQGLFHRATSTLRRVLEPDLPDKFPSRYLDVDQGRITLELPSGSQVDFEQFEQQVRASAWEAALDLYQGELFPVDRYANWAAGPRERLAQMAIRTLLAAAEQRLEAGDPARALDACRRVLALEPWLEDAVLLGMRACIAQRNRAGAVRFYQELKSTLREELGIGPQKDLTEFYQSLL